MPGNHAQCCCGEPCSDCGTPPDTMTGTYADVEMATACVFCDVVGSTYHRARVDAGTINGTWPFARSLPDGPYAPNGSCRYVATIPITVLWTTGSSFFSTCDVAETIETSESATATMERRSDGSGGWVWYNEVVVDGLPLLLFKGTGAGTCEDPDVIANDYTAFECGTIFEGGNVGKDGTFTATFP